MKLIIDTDPGVDDALAIMLACARPEVDLLGIVTVGGNVEVEQATTNAAHVLALCGRAEVPLHQGCPRPLLGQLNTARIVHGAHGLGEANSRPWSPPEGAPHGVSWLIDTLRGAAEPVTLLMIGPQTNLATALTLAPDVASGIGRLLVMGGTTLEHGNTGPVGEFNVTTDPLAARIVLDHGLHPVYAPLDITRDALMTPERLAAIAAIGTEAAREAAGWMRFYSRFDRERFGKIGGPLHDPVPLAWALEPDICRVSEVRIDIVTDGGPAHGMSVIDYFHQRALAPNARVLHDLDAERFFGLLGTALGSLP